MKSNGFLVFAAMTLSLALAGGARASVASYWWVQIVAGGEYSARAIVPGLDVACPQLDTPTGTAMKARTNPNSTALPVTVCEAKLPATTTKVTLGGNTVALLKAAPKKIAVIGDTGCRIKDEDDEDSADADSTAPDNVKWQACDDPKKWPFQSVANNAARGKPELIVHVGDFLYRESPCPADAPGCKGSPWGYNWPTWETDFFLPAKALLTAAPWALARGNHEDCGRAWQGWFYFFSPEDLAAGTTCNEHTALFTIDARGLPIVVIDSSTANDFKADPKQAKLFADDFEAISKMGLKNAWLLTHRPTWSAKGGKGNALQVLNLTLQAAWATSPPQGVALQVAGHMHMFELLGFADGKPPQLVAGNGGTKLTHKFKPSLKDKQLKAAKVNEIDPQHKFGYTLMKRTQKGWSLNLHDANGKKLQQCKLEQTKVNCKER